MRILALETSTDQFGVALIDEQRVLAAYEILAERPHAVELPQAVMRVVKAARMTLEQVDAFAIDIGPGSFTGLRVGVAFLKALVFHLRKPVVGIVSLDALAANVLYAPRLVCPLLDAKQKKVYAAWYRTDPSTRAPVLTEGPSLRASLHPRRRVVLSERSESKDNFGRLQRQTEPLLLPFEDLPPKLTEPVILLGDGARVYRRRLQDALGDRAIFAPPEWDSPRAATVGRLALERLSAGEQDDPNTLVPLYLYARDSSVRKPAASVL